MQRGTLLDLQDALLELADHTQEVDNALLLGGHLKSRAEAAGRVVPEATKEEVFEREHQARDRFRATLAKVRLLESRVLNDDARHAVGLFAVTCLVAIPAMNRPAKADLDEVAARYADAIDRLGELLRERY